MLTEKEKFLAWYKKEKEENGLLYCKPIIDMDPYTGKVNIPEGTTEEDIYRAMNALNDAVANGRFKIVTDL
jgi:hypothetical protein